MELLQVGVGVILAVLGWVIGHWFTSKRDVKNSQRTIRISALTEVYKALVRCGTDGVMIKRAQDGSITDDAKHVEEAIALIHLYGTQQQSLLASKYVNRVASVGSGSLTELVDALRKNIRESLGGIDIEGQPNYLKVTYQDGRPNR